jgi:LmbE family N-acetylglucosaminyl deacetylase
VSDDPPARAADETVVFFHAHPDDESIFTGGTISLLAAHGVRTVVVIATAGERGVGNLAPAPAGIRAAEAEAACRILGVDALHFLGYADSDTGENGPSGFDLFHAVPVGEAAQRLAKLLRDERATALVTYDDGGIYAHPDHLAVHRVGTMAAELADVGVVYEATVDREYLHFVETHLVGHAIEWLLGEDAMPVTNRAPLGVPTVMVSTTVDVRAAIALKRAAIAAHASQLPPRAAIHQMDDETFAAVYGFEWFIRRGPAGVIEAFGF